ncbi:putative Kunitz-type serine protease inhibitor [Exaiptasia diaphana]|uniref:BPTI/Kunitz inhibitor domain-containing protein n=1 Tax=Exaiptasia diaphana TaxID=2652724 RepID=A0A913XH31_EXADI|nr:putative Kunitz-type serine protease inhibitor [Exaiptasia diaphana]KXJ11883.1 Kunitz-type protease inhibitor 2 [Exaiptasia diaphana]
MMSVILILCQMTLAMSMKGKDLSSNDNTSLPINTTNNTKNDVCLLPKMIGPGRASLPRFFFDAKSGKCKKFNFGGIKGNANNFLTKKECVEKCADQVQNTTSQPPTTSEPITPKPIQRDICFLPKKIGKGRASLPRFYFSLATGQCEKFTFGGGKGNANNFLTKKECEEKCFVRVQNTTSQPPTTSQPTTQMPNPAVTSTIQPVMTKEETDNN